jgi:hypothetical protein
MQHETGVALHGAAGAVDGGVQRGACRGSAP